MLSVKKEVFSGVFFALYCFSFSAGAAVVPKNAEADLYSLKSFSNSSESLQPASSAPASPGGTRIKKTPSAGNLMSIFSPRISKRKNTLTSPSSGSLARPFSMGGGSVLHTSVQESNDNDSRTYQPESLRRRRSSESLERPTSLGGSIVLHQLGYCDDSRTYQPESPQRRSSDLAASPAKVRFEKQESQGSLSSLGNLEGGTFETLETLDQTAQHNVFSEGNEAKGTISQTSSLSTHDTMDEETLKKIKINLKKAFEKEEGWINSHAVYLHFVDRMIDAVTHEATLQKQLTSVLNDFEKSLEASQEARKTSIKNRKDSLTNLSNKYTEFLKKNKKKLAKRKMYTSWDNQESNSLSMTLEENETAVAYLQKSIDTYIHFLDELEADEGTVCDSTYYRNKLKQVATYTLLNHYTTLHQNLDTPEELEEKTTPEEIKSLLKFM